MTTTVDWTQMLDEIWRNEIVGRHLAHMPLTRIQLRRTAKCFSVHNWVPPVLALTAELVEAEYTGLLRQRALADFFAKFHVDLSKDAIPHAAIRALSYRLGAHALRAYDLREFLALHVHVRFDMDDLVLAVGDDVRALRFLFGRHAHSIGGSRRDAFASVLQLAVQRADTALLMFLTREVARDTWFRDGGKPAAATSRSRSRVTLTAIKESHIAGLLKLYEAAQSANDGIVWLKAALHFLHTLCDHGAARTNVGRAFAPFYKRALMYLENAR